MSSLENIRAALGALLLEGDMQWMRAVRICHAYNYSVGLAWHHGLLIRSDNDGSITWRISDKGRRVFLGEEDL